jgi:predicted 3-demethylubiquinone-9 3-methyltransferase (glyoxalase superfamily)
MKIMQKITPFLWFDNNAEEAMNFYVSVFKDSKVEQTSRYGEGGPGPAGSFMVGTFTLDGQEFMVLNGGPHYKLTPAFSLMVYCDNQQEIDYYWDKLSEGGTEVQCGWLTDKFGLSWQVVPTMFMELMRKGTPEQTNRMMQALYQMKKLIIADLQKAFDG